VRVTKINSAVTQESDRFPCSRCGALLKFGAGTQNLVCEYCGQENFIENRLEEIREYNLHEALAQLAEAPPVSESMQIQCEACGAHFKFETSVHAGECPFCGTDVVTSTAQSRSIKPKSLLPFRIDDSQARQQFRAWLGGLWFAPNALKKYARDDTKLMGVYLPHWTFDSNTASSYTGARGDVYYVRQRVVYVQNGRRVSAIKRIPKIRWTPVRGRVARFFDDVLVGASRSLPRQILDKLQPWDLESLVPYNESYLSGFSSEFYQVDLDEGFDRAKQVMDSVVRQDIAFDIGGDQQRIHQVRTRHQDSTYKHCLLPVWSAAFRYRDESYRFVINARSGQVQGERPYSVWKIVSTVILGAALIGGVLVYLEQSGALQQIQNVDYGY